jgi:hypothetical protein
MTETLFRDIKTFDNFIEIDEHYRLYFDVIDYGEEKNKKSGFEFIALECFGYVLDGKNEYYFSPTSSVAVVVEGIAYFDGVRHLYYGNEKTDNYGYHYYPNLSKIIKVLEELKKLEEKYCSIIN